MVSLLARPVTLAYHGVGEVTEAQDPNTLVVAPDLLREHLRLLRRRGYRFTTAEGVLEEGPPGHGTAVLTFDDGWRDNLTHALPILQEFEVPATFYVCPGWWGQQHPDVDGPHGALLTEDEALALVDAGMELGSHTLTHPDLRRLDDGELRRQLRDSKAAVEQLTGRPCRTFAYPSGLFDDRVEQAVDEAGYELAWDWLPGSWAELAAPRLPAPCRHGARRLGLKLLGVRRFWQR